MPISCIRASHDKKTISFYDPKIDFGQSFARKCCKTMFSFKDSGLFPIVLYTDKKTLPVKTKKGSAYSVLKFYLIWDKPSFFTVYTSSSFFRRLSVNTQVIKYRGMQKILSRCSQKVDKREKGKWNAKLKEENKCRTGDALWLSIKVSNRRTVAELINEKQDIKESDIEIELWTFSIRVRLDRV